ncbi:MAG: 4Fe-4S binding protein [Candidatus Helarchaeota archaeon]|nr:4Fe-4S binding protein [Candidatus Helarchaeota archaeon]
MALRSVIFYFSQSGNTKKFAEKIKEGLSNGEHTCELIRFKKLKDDIKLIKNFNFSKYNLIGFGIPVYYFKPPFHILDILEALPSLQGKNGFLFCTSGGNPGATLHKMNVITDKKGLKIIDSNDQFIGLDKHQLYRDFDFTLPSSIGHPTEEELEKAREFGIQLIKKALNSNTPEKTDFWTKESDFAKMTSFEGLNEQFPKIKLNEDKCIQCGKCAETCPVDAIILDPYPRWIKDCDRCYICEMWCPEQAIECDWNWQVEVMNSLMRKKGYTPKRRKK